MRLAIFKIKETKDDLAVNPEHIILRSLANEVWVYDNVGHSSFIIEETFDRACIEADNALNYIPEYCECKEKVE